jgi:hypothetical protein
MLLPYPPPYMELPPYPPPYPPPPIVLPYPPPSGFRVADRKQNLLVSHLTT